MKKLLALTMALTMIATLAACGGSSSSSSSAASTASGSSAPESSSSVPASEAASTGETPNIDRIKAAGKIIMLTNLAFPPFEYVGDDGQGAGVDIDISKEIAKDLGVELEIVNMDFGGIIDSLKAGKGDFSAAGMTIKPDRQQQVDFTIEYTKSAQYVIIKKGSGVTADLNGKTVAVQESTTGDLYVTDEFKTKEVMRFKSGIDAAAALRSGKCDAVVIDKLPAEELAGNSNGELECLPESLTEESYAIALKKDSPDLLEAINKTLQRLMDEGKIDDYITEHVTKA